MRRVMVTGLLSLAVLTLGAGDASAQPRGKRVARPVTPTISAEEVELIYFQREEEKLARDVYLTLYAIHEGLGDRAIQVFDKIADSEQKHMDAVGQLMTTYGLPDRVDPDVIGAFANPYLQQLYGDLVELGATIEGAYMAGWLIEVMDIVDLEAALENPAVVHKDIRRVFENLLRGSYRHLDAFESKLSQL